MDLDALLPIIDDIVKESLNEKVYVYGRYQKGTTRRVASGKLVNSIKSVIQDNKQGVQIIQVQSNGVPLNNTYAYWLINGRQPGPAIGSQKGRKKTGSYSPGPFVSGIMEWIRNKRDFKIRDMKTGQFLPKNEKNIKSVAYVIARSIGMFGFQNQPKNFVEISYDKIKQNPQIAEIIEQATYDELLNLIEGL